MNNKKQEELSEFSAGPLREHLTTAANNQRGYGISFGSWVAIADQLPPIDKWVLVWWHGPEIVQRKNDTHFYSGCLHIPIERVTHWMPILPPPKA